MQGLARRCGPQACELASGLKLSTEVLSQDLSGPGLPFGGESQLG
jgi:hypothetical protein